MERFSASPTVRTHGGGSVPIAPETTLGAVSLTVSDVERARAFYERTLGLCARASPDDGDLELGAPGSEAALVRLRADMSAPALDRHATGLYHLAIVLPSRLDLGHALHRLAAAHWPLDGASDHLVSEAVYLSDPDRNGIEIYCDRPRTQWRRIDGQIQMATLPLDLRGVFDEVPAGAGPETVVPAGTRIGHVHLQVADLRAAEVFYHGLLGFDVTARGYPGALFLSAGGYHHHIGVNTWHSAGSAPARPGSVGLRSYEVLLPGERALTEMLERLRAADLPLISAPATDPRAPATTSADGISVRDPSGNLVVLRSA